MVLGEGFYVRGKRVLPRAFKRLLEIALDRILALDYAKVVLLGGETPLQVAVSADETQAATMVALPLARWGQ